jgi:hypothetical protein
VSRTEQPKLLRDDSQHDYQTYTHPAFGAISAHRIQGQAHLFASHVKHNGFVQIELSTAVLNCNSTLGETVHGGHERVAVVWMSEAQWVAFISRMNCGAGTPCTFHYRQNGPLKEVPELPDPTDPAGRLQHVVDDVLRRDVARIEKQAKQIHDILDTLPARKANEIWNLVEHMKQHLIANHKFQAEKLTKHKEELVVEAKVELDAMVNGLLTKLGIDSLQQLHELTQHGLKALTHDDGLGDD